LTFAAAGGIERAMNNCSNRFYYRLVI